MIPNRSLQPMLVQLGALAIGCSKAYLDGESVGALKSATLQLEPTLETMSFGYPAITYDNVLTALTATTTLELDEIGGVVFDLIAEIVASLEPVSLVSDYEPIKKQIELEVFRPAAVPLSISSNVLLKQQFELNFSENDFNSVAFELESYTEVFGIGQADNLLEFANSARPQQLGSPISDVKNLSIGKPKISIERNGIPVSLGAVGATSLKLTTNYRRLEYGVPKILKSLVPLSHDVELTVASEEMTGLEFTESVSNARCKVIYELALVGGEGLRITLPDCRITPVTGVELSIAEFSTIARKFVATKQSGSLITVERI